MSITVVMKVKLLDRKEVVRRFNVPTDTLQVGQNERWILKKRSFQYEKCCFGLRLLAVLVTLISST